MNSMDLKQIKEKVYAKMGDARWHHCYEIYNVFSIEPAFVTFNINSLFMKDFLICNTRCDVCDQNSCSTHYGLFLKTRAQLINQQINILYFYCFLPNFLSKIDLLF